MRCVCHNVCSGRLEGHRDRNASTVLASIGTCRRSEADSLIFCGEGALNSDRLVRVLHDNWVGLDDNMVDVASPSRLNGATLGANWDPQSNLRSTIAKLNAG